MPGYDAGIQKLHLGVPNNSVWFFFKDLAQSDFSMKFIPEDEIFAFTSPTSSHVKLEPNHNNMLRLDFKLYKRIRHCDPLISRMTPCVLNSYPNYNKSESKFKIEMYNDLTDTSFAGYEALSHLTKCQPPCDTVHYNVEKYLNFNRKIDGEVNGTEGQGFYK